MRHSHWRWVEACLYCKGYPGYDKCFCTLKYKLRRLRMRLWRVMNSNIRWYKRRKKA